MFTTTVKSKHGLNIACWNIRRGLLKRELELGILLVKIDSDVMFLTKTDCDVIKTKEDYKLEGYETEIQLRQNDESKTRLIVLIKNECAQSMKIRRDLMSAEFPSIWLEYDNKREKPILIGFFCSFFVDFSREITE